ncbi:MAG TPA: hypothetical protein VMZ49_00160 [Patescibacteria group bacterium]|nr:hypothetical protein [Patescibacteria group bacterium]
MLATETKRIFKDGVIIFMVLAAIFAGIVASDQDVYLAPALEIFLLLYASFTGWSMFERERQENAGEYMLSLPLSRSRLLLLKFLPRLLSVSLTFLIYLRLHQSWQLPSFLSPFDFSLLYAGFFLLSIAFSISFKNFISAFFITCLLSIGQILLIKLLDNSREIGQIILQANLTVLVFPLFFFFLFQRYDIKPVSTFNKKFFPGLLAATGLIAGFIFYQAPANWKNLTLTPTGLILKNSCVRSEITLERGRKRIPGCLTMLRESEDGNTLYCMTRKLDVNSRCIETSIVALDLKTGDLQTLYRIPPGWTIYEGHYGEFGSIRNGTYSLFLQKPKSKKAMILEIDAGKVKTFPIRGDFYDSRISYVLHLAGEPRQLVIFSEPRLYRLHVSGQVEELAKTNSLDVWQDKILLFESSGVNLYRVGEQLIPLLQRKGNYKKSPRRLGGYESPGVIYRTDRSYFWLDMKQQKEEKLELKSPPYTYQQSGDHFYVVFVNGTVFTIRDMRTGKQNEMVWDPGFKPAAIRISPFGMLVFRDQKYKVYPFKN